MSNGDRTRIPIQHMPSGHFAIGDNLGGPDAPDMEPVENAATFYRPVPSLQYAIHRPRRDATQPVSVAPEVHAVPTVTRRQAADPGLAEMAEKIMDSIDVAFRSAQRGPGFLVSAEQTQVIRSGVRNGVMVVGEEIEWARGMLTDAATMIEQIAATPGLTDTAGAALVALARAMRAGMAVRK